ncbi:odorant receptor 2a-like [Aricia agestis]|uniref:odorant receptor 2a-like n=1 Tax=Aricia agestis TaxID=91739 RepID=UPI001C205AB8|nr:odorant receptor 2a-like [Aricia agestis]
MSFLREYSLDKCDLPTLFSNVSVMLRCVTLNIYQDAKRSPLWAYCLTYITVVAYLYTYILSTSWFVFVRCRQTGDLVSASVIFSEGCNSCTCITKFIVMNVHRKILCELVSRYLDCDAQVVPGSRFHQNLMKHTRIVKKRALGIFFALMGITALFILRSQVRPGRHLPQDIYVMYGLEPTFETPNYEMSLFLMVLCLAVCVYEIAVVKALVVIMVGYIESQLLALSEECANIWDDTKTSIDDNRGKDNKIINKEVELKLKNIVRFHVININNLNDFDEFYRFISFADFTLIGAAIISELLGKLENTFLDLPYTFLQIYIDCYIGQRLSDAISRFENAVYECRWENFNAKNMKTVLLLLKMSQKTATVTAGGITPLNYITLMSVIKSTYSAYTTLRSSVS